MSDNPDGPSDVIPAQIPTTSVLPALIFALETAAEQLELINVVYQLNTGDFDVNAALALRARLAVSKARSLQPDQIGPAQRWTAEEILRQEG